jgi:tryptophan synthase beta subunit
VSFACRLAREQGRNRIVLVNLSGRGDKDIANVAS